mmetsp:Transcript_10068/g.24446  ORF Transcript_10068/g.24446 Transcript_10068/m.24446 type:complete len:736 (+) Transcript_10068:65-2272(+)
MKIEADGDPTKKADKKKKKKTKKEKKEKRKRKRDAIGDDECQQQIANGVDQIGLTTSLERDNDKDLKKKKKKKAKKKAKKAKSDEKKKKNQNSNDESSDNASVEDTVAGDRSDGRLVASSAIEFYDADLKNKAKKRQKLMTEKEKVCYGSGITIPDGLEEELEAQRSKSKLKSKRRRDRTNDKKSDRTKDQILEQQKKRDEIDQENKHNHNLTLLLFYQYIEPEWDDDTHQKMLRDLKRIGNSLELTGRMRCAKEGLNCTLTGTHESILDYTKALRQLRPNDFRKTEFKLTTDLPIAQKFGELKVLDVLEIVRYGLEGQKAPPIRQYSGVHLEPKDYHKKLAESNTVIIDVRNHYEASIGRFVPPNENPESKDSVINESQKNGPQWIDPKMRKSTEFPAWLDKDETKELMKGKQVLMYCTGGIRCERASALLKYKMETDQAVKGLGIKGVYQLQGGIDKYFKEFPDGGYWKGKNYVFDKRFAHAPPKIDGELHGRVKDDTNNRKNTEAFPSSSSSVATNKMGKCEACHKPWDMYRGKRRCPTCGVPSLICKECFLADKNGTKKLGREVRCDLCVEQGIFTKRDYKERDERFISSYESRMMAKGLLLPNATGEGSSGNNADGENGSRVAAPTVPNPKQITRLVLKNMCRKNMTEDALMEALPGITHIQWNTIRNRKNPDAEPIFTGMGWAEMATPEDAALAVARSNKLSLFRRPLGIAFQPPDGKDIWPPPNSRIA